MPNMTTTELRKHFDRLPIKEMIFKPTHLHRLDNLSTDLGINLYLKREDMPGPNSFAGGKMRKLELIIGQALENGIDHIVTYGAYQSNSAMQIAVVCKKVGIKPILFLGDTKVQGRLDNPSGNLLLDYILGAEIIYVDKPEPKDSLDLNPLWVKVREACFAKVAELNRQGYNAMFVDVGSAHEFSWPSDVIVLAELIEQSRAMNFSIDYIYHTNGSCSSLPGMIAAKYLSGADIEFRSINVRSWKKGNLITKNTCHERVRGVFERFGLPCPPDEFVYANMNIYEDYLGPGYGIPNERGQAAIKMMARREGIMLDPVYTGKGFSGLVDHVGRGLIPQGKNVVFIHTGGTVALFSDPALTVGLVD